ncbi:hypothetical protein J437_LFUL001698 [Ladona fulva]|uniref:Uncharacterized protein n=1 Tax=Ladona fulva TaxID=123851 RepID=A0A8K0K2K6_LADFU|nr:hypothetical protein J437_LFUL001698 [Ladona fulva]
MEKSGFPGVIGAVDGTHVSTVPPVCEREHDFANRKGFHSKNVQISMEGDLFLRPSQQQPSTKERLACKRNAVAEEEDAKRSKILEIACQCLQNPSSESQILAKGWGIEFAKMRPDQLCESYHQNLSFLSELRQLIGDLRSEVEALKNKLEDNNVTKRSTTADTEDMNLELSERQRRAYSVIIFNIPESSDNDGDEVAKVRETLKAVPDVSLPCIHAHRLGIKRSTGIRPVKVIMGSPRDV